MSSENVDRDLRVPFNKLEFSEKMEEVKASKQFIVGVAGMLND